jgi:hypothetical protein
MPPHHATWQELVDFEMPPELGWEALPPHDTATTTPTTNGTSRRAARRAARRSTHRVAACAAPFRWVQADRAAGEHAEAERRQQLLAFWRLKGKFRVPTATPTQPLADGEHAASGAKDGAGRHAAEAPNSRQCALAFGGRTGRAEGSVSACAYLFPDGQRTAAAAHKDCWAWCAGTLSAAHAHVSLVHARLPNCSDVHAGGCAG